MTILERLARVAPYVQAERAAGITAAEERTIMAIEIAVVEPTIQRTIPLSESEAKKQSRLLKALADPTRMRIVSFLSRYPDEVCVRKIVTHFDLCQPTISHHLAKLQNAGIIDSRREALYVYYFVRSEVLAQLCSSIWGLTAEGKLQHG